MKKSMNNKKIEKKLKTNLAKNYNRDYFEIDVNNNIGLYTIVDKKANLVSEYLAVVPKVNNKYGERKI